MDKKYNKEKTNASLIFKNNAWKLHERGYGFIPANGKIPAVDSWTMYTKKGVSDMTLEAWEQQFPNHNIGLLTGKNTGIVAIDYDGLDPNSPIAKLIPKSEVERVGKKGHVRLFKYNGEKNAKFHAINIEIFSCGTFIAIPPSIHPDTKKPYEWTSLKSVYEVDDPSELEVLPDGLIEEFKRLNDEAKQFVKAKERKTGVKSGGRNTSLFEAACAMVNANDPREYIDSELRMIDSNFVTSWLSDENEPHKGDVTKALDGLFNRALSLCKDEYNGEGLIPQSTIDRWLKKYEDEQAKLEFIEDVSEDDEIKEVKLRLPQPSGSLKHVYDYCLEQNIIERKGFSLASSVTLIAAMLSNKVIFKGTYTNLYQMIIAKSGSGKDAPLNFPKECLSEISEFKMIGLASYRSDKVIAKTLDKKRERIDTIDEISGLFKGMNAGVFGATSNAGELLSTLYSRSGKYYEGMSNSQATVGTCYSPCISILGATTPSAFKGTFSIENIGQGIGGRFLYFIDEEYQSNFDLNHSKQFKFKKDKTHEFLNAIKNVKIKKKPTITNSHSVPLKDCKTMAQAEAMHESGVNIPDPIKLECNKEVENLIIHMSKEYLKKAHFEDHLMAPIYSRAMQNILKVAIVHWSSRVFETNGNFKDTRIDSIDILWAQAYVEASYEALGNLLLGVSKNRDLEFELAQTLHSYLSRQKNKTRKQTLVSAGMKVSIKRLQPAIDQLVSMNAIQVIDKKLNGSSKSTRFLKVINNIP